MVQSNRDLSVIEAELSYMLVYLINKSKKQKAKGLEVVRFLWYAAKQGYISSEDVTQNCKIWQEDFKRGVDNWK